MLKTKSKAHITFFEGFFRGGTIQIKKDQFSESFQTEFLLWGVVHQILHRMEVGTMYSGSLHGWVNMMNNIHIIVLLYVECGYIVLIHQSYGYT